MSTIHDISLSYNVDEQAIYMTLPDGTSHRLTMNGASNPDAVRLVAEAPYSYTEPAHVRLSYLQEQVNQLRRTESQMRADFNHVAESLLDEANRRDWCSEYDRFVSDVNDGTAHFDLIRRRQTYRMYFDGTATFDCSPGQEDNVANRIASALYGCDNCGGERYSLVGIDVGNIEPEDDD